MWGKLIKQFFFKNEYSNLILRKTKSFNKSRYSRNRQYYRTGVYWCLWLNIILVFALYYVFYKYTFKFSYIFIFYIVSSVLCLLAFFSKNYFLGFTKVALGILEPIIFDIILKLKIINLNVCIVWHHEVIAPMQRLKFYILEYRLVQKLCILGDRIYWELYFIVLTIRKWSTYIIR